MEKKMFIKNKKDSDEFESVAVPKSILNIVKAFIASEYHFKRFLNSYSREFDKLTEKEEFTKDMVKKTKKK